MTGDVGSTVPAVPAVPAGTVPSVGAEGDALPPAPAPPPIVAATWQSRPAEEPWVPERIAERLPWTRDVVYRDVDSVEGDTGTGWRVLGTSQRGRVHAHDGTHREDALAAEWGAHGFALAAADGAGSSRYSRIAAALVCRHIAQAAVPILRDGLPPKRSGDAAAVLRPLLADAVASACDELCATAEATGLATRDFRTTALAVVCIGGTLAAVQVGDGAIVTVARDGRVTRVATGDSGSYSGEVAAFVPELDRAAIATRVVSTTLDEVEAILVLTDGIEDPFYPIERRGSEIARQLYHGVSAVAEGFRAQATHGPVVHHPEGIARLAEWIAFERRGENDDRTLLGAFRSPGTLER